MQAAKPTPQPTRKRPPIYAQCACLTSTLVECDLEIYQPTILQISWQTACPIAPPTKMMSAIARTGRRPVQSESMPATRAPISAPRVVAEVINSWINVDIRTIIPNRTQRWRVNIAQDQLNKLTFWPFDRFSGPKSFRMLTKAPETTPVSYPVKKSSISADWDGSEKKANRKATRILWNKERVTTQTKSSALLLPPLLRAR